MRDMNSDDGRVGSGNFLIAALIGFFIGVAIWIWNVPGLDPVLWEDTAVVAGLRPARAIFPGFWRLTVGWMFPLWGVKGAVAELGIVGAIGGGCCAALFYLIVRHVLAFVIRVERHYPFWSRYLAPIFASFAALAFGMSNPLWSIARTFSPDMVRLFLLLLIVYGTLRWFAAGGRWRLLPVMVLMGVLSSETPFGFLLPMLFIFAYLAMRRCVLNGLFPWPERLPDLESMPRWWMFFLFFSGFAAGVWMNVRSFLAYGGLEANGLALVDIYLRYAVGYWHMFAHAATFVGWMLGLCFCALPCIIAVRIAPLIIRDDHPIPFRLGVIMLSAGFLALLQTNLFPSAQFWTLVSGSILFSSGFMLTVFVLCAMLTLGLCGAAFAFECRRTYLRDEPEKLPGPALRWMVPTIACVLVLVMATFLPRPVEIAVQELVDDAVCETVRECGDAKWIFTDGHLDAAIELEAQSEGKTLRALNMMAGASPWEIAVRQRGLDPSSDEYAVAETGVPVLLRLWAGERPARLDEAALQLGFEIWKRDRKDLPPASGLVARTKGIDAAESARGVENACALAKRILEITPKMDMTLRTSALAEALSAVNWRISRFARMRDDMTTAINLEESNFLLKQILTTIENERVRTFMLMTPREGLQMALGRADFVMARRYAAPILANDEEDPEANFAQGMSELVLGRYKEAEVYLKRCLIRRPDEPATLNNLSIICRKLGRYEESEEYARKAIKRLPNSPEVKRTLADILDVRKKLGDVVPASEK